MFGVAILATVFSSAGSYQSPTAFVDGLQPAVFVGAAIVAVGAVVALALPAAGRVSPSRRRPSRRRPRRQPQRRSAPTAG